MVFQSYALYPHMSVRANIGFALKMAGDKRRRDRAARCGKAAATLNLTDYLDRKPRQLSGGQRQRVAIGRAIVREPKAFLFDEPLSNLDAALRVQMRVEIGELHNTLKTTMIYVTHDQVEAMTMANKIVVLDKGSVMQVGSPLELYNRPNGLFVAGFIGSPMMNLIRGEAAAKRGATTIGIRPEHADVSTTAGEWRAKIRLAEHLGSDTFLHAEAEGIGPLTLRLAGESASRRATAIFVTPRRRTCIASTKTAGGWRDGASLPKTIEWDRNYERQTFRRRAGADCPRASPRRAMIAPTSAPASFTSASAISTARIRRSISTICSLRDAITTGRSSAPACANTTSTCAPSSPPRIT